jgi:hypothetical protein
MARKPAFRMAAAPRAWPYDAREPRQGDPAVTELRGSNGPRRREIVVRAWFSLDCWQVFSAVLVGWVGGEAPPLRRGEALPLPGAATSRR